MINRRVGIRIPTKLSIPKQDFSQSWEILESALNHIYAEDTEKLSFGDLYRTIYTQVLNRNGEKLYSAFEAYMAKKLDEIRELTFTEHVLSDNDSFLLEMGELWKKQSDILKTISDLTIYMDKVYSKPNRVPEIHELGLQIFKKHILMKIKDQLLNSILADINSVRDCQELDLQKAHLWKLLVSMMETITDTKDTFYLNYFEPKFLNDTGLYYKKSFTPTDKSATECLEKIRVLQSFEIEMCEDYLNKDTILKLNHVLEEVLYNQKLNIHVPELIKISFEQDNYELLDQIYTVSLSDDYRLQIVNAIKSYMLKHCNNSEPKEIPKKRYLYAMQWTARVLATYKKCHEFLSNVNFGSVVVRKSEADNETETKAYNSAVISNEVFSEYLNQDGKRSSEFVTIYLDSCLKLSIEKQKYKQVKQDLDAAVKLFKLLQEKDIFSQYYQQQLSKRLLQQKSSLDLERWLITQIKSEMGSLFTSKLEGMLRDVNSSIELYKTFQNTTKEAVAGFMFKPQILTPTSWPFQAPDRVDPNFKLPETLQGIQDSFETFYTNKYNQRILKWSHHLSSIEVGYQFAKTYHEIHLPIYAASIFFLFENHDSLTKDGIQDMTGLPDVELDKLLLSMTTAPRSKILVKSPPSKIINSTDTFAINEDFTAPTTKVKLQMIIGVVQPNNGTGEPNKASIMDNVERERQEVTNAAIVRLMKSERHLQFSELQEKTAVQLAQRFTLSLATFKACIETLIEKEYIQRDVDDHEFLHYIT